MECIVPLIDVPAGSMSPLMRKNKVQQCLGPVILEAKLVTEMFEDGAERGT